MSETDWLHADWPAIARVHTLITTRNGGVSQPPYASLNLGTHVDDSAESVSANRALLRAHLPAEPAWLNQVHGTQVLRAEQANHAPDADASFTRQSNTVCVIMTADCLPVLLCDRQGTVVGAAHAGWRGLCNGILEATIAAMGVEPGDLMAWMGPAIGPDAFEVGQEVRSAFMEHHSSSDSAFTPIGDNQYLADIYLLAKQRLHRAGVAAVYGGGRCTVIERDQFFSYRRDRRTGRMASLIWLEP